MFGGVHYHQILLCNLRFWCAALFTVDRLLSVALRALMLRLIKCSTELVVDGGQLLLSLLRIIRGSLLDNPARSSCGAEIACQIRGEHFPALAGVVFHCFWFEWVTGQLSTQGIGIAGGIRPCCFVVSFVLLSPIFCFSFFHLDRGWRVPTANGHPFL